MTHEPHAGPIVELERVSAPFGITIDKPMDLSIEAGERLWIHGPSGVGKTSLLYVIGALARPRAGRVTVLGRDVRRESQARRVRANSISFVLQDAPLVENWSLLQNVRAAVGARRLDRAHALLAEWQINTRRSSPRSLSGGERQRVAIVCALARESRLIVADEPTSSLDARNRQTVLTMFSALPQTAAVVVASHDPEWKDWATRTLDLGAPT